MPTRNELKLLEYLGLSESDEIFVVVGDGGDGHVISMDRKNGEPLETVVIPFSDLPHKKYPSSGIEIIFGRWLFCYPRIGRGTALRIQAKNLRILLYDIEAQSRVLKERESKARKAEEEAERIERLLLQNEYGGLNVLDNDRVA